MKTVGEILKNGRKEKRLTLTQISTKTRINKNYLKALEKNNYEQLPEAAFVKGFIRNYAKAVDLNPSQALAIFRRDYDQNVKGQVIPRSFVDSPSGKRSLWTPKTSIIVAVSLVVIILSIYFVYQYRLLASPPALEVNSPLEEEHVKPTLNVAGTTDPQATLSINNQTVQINQDGSFSQSLVLLEGTRTITIQSTSRFGKTRNIQRTVHVEP